MKFVRAALLIAILPITVVAETSNPQELFSQAVSAQQHGDYARAAELYRRLVNISPQVPAGWINLGAALLNLGRYSEAVQSFQKALALDPSNYQIRFALSLALYKEGDFAEASHGLDPLQKANPSDLRVAALLADCQLHLGRAHKALTLLEPLASRAAPGSDFSYIYGSALIANGHLKEGADVLESYAKAKGSPDAYVAAGNALLRLNLSERALADLQAGALIAPNFPGLYTKLGEALEKNSRYSDAAEAYKKATVQNPKDLAAWVGLGANLYSLRKIPSARQAIAQALRLDPSSVDAHYTMALIEKSEGHITAAVSDLETVVKARPKFVPAHAELSALYFKLHRPQEGIHERQIVDQLANEARKQGP